VDTANAVGITTDKGGGINASPPQMSRVGAHPDDVWAKRLQQPDDFLFGFEDTADVRVVQWTQTLVLQHLADDPAVFDGEFEPVSVEVRAHGRLGHSRRYRHRGDHRAIQAKSNLIGREPLRALDLIRDVDRLVEW
jgi:hypothetical protein